MEIVSSRPPYIPAPDSGPATDYGRYYVTWGIANNVIADNWDDYFDITTTTYFFVKATFSTSSDSLLVASTEILTGAAWDTHQTPEWSTGGERPEYYVFSIGSVQVVTDGGGLKTFYIHPSPGSVMITEHLSNIAGTGSVGAVQLTKQLAHYTL